MRYLKVIAKILIILAIVTFMAMPLIMQYVSFRKDKKEKISYKRFRLLVFTAFYLMVITVVMCLIKKFILWLETLSLIQWISRTLALSSRTIYFNKVLVVVLVNFAIGALYRLVVKLVRKGLKKKNLTIPKIDNKKFDWKQKAERKIIRFFHKETWFFVGQTLKYVNIILSAGYVVLFILYQLVAVFAAEWLNYDVVSMIFHSGYLYPTITLLGLWEIYFFLSGNKRLMEECPEILIDNVTLEYETPVPDIKAIDEEIRKQFADYYICDVDLSGAPKNDIKFTPQKKVTDYIAQSIENDKRNVQARKELYLSCIDKIIDNENSILINGNLFTEFSMYFLRYASAIIARGDVMLFVCNTESQIDMVYDYLKKSFTEIFSLYCNKDDSDNAELEKSIWRIAKVSSAKSATVDSHINDNNIIVTTLDYLCSEYCNSEYNSFITFVDSVVIVNTLETVNAYNRQLANLNTKLKHIIRKNALAAKYGVKEGRFKARYASRKVRYICFDDTRTPGLDKILKNLLAVEMDSLDAMRYNPGTIVRCYSFEGKPNEEGRINDSQVLKTEERIGVIMNMAIICLAKGASNVTIFADDIIPYENIAETLSANMGQVSISVGEDNIRINKPFYNPDDYSVIIAMNSDNNLPAHIRRYASMTSDKPSLVIVFAKPYLLRDYYTANIKDCWNRNQIERIPVEEGTIRDIARKIIIRANSGGISVEEILRLAADVPQFDAYCKEDNINGILRSVLEIYGIPRENRIDLFDCFEYTVNRSFDENGMYQSHDMITLRRGGKLYEMINGRNMVTMSIEEGEITLPIPRSRLTQNYIADQNLVYNGKIYHIQKVDTESKKLYAKLAPGGRNDEVYQYIQNREYRIEFKDEPIEYTAPTKHITVNLSEDDVKIDDVFVSVFRVPTEVITKGYYTIDPHTLSLKCGKSAHYSISDEKNDILAKQTYRRYGEITEPFYSSDSIQEVTQLNASRNGALMMLVRMSGQFGVDTNKVMLLAAVMLNELIRAMFPSVADSVVVCPVLHGEAPDDEGIDLYGKESTVTIRGESDLLPDSDFELLIIEDCEEDLGVISVLMSSGDDVLNTLFSPIYDYLKWYTEAEEKSKFLYYGLEQEPSCFDFASLYKLSKLLGDNAHDFTSVDLEAVIEYDNCDFCGKRFAKCDENVVELNDGRIMCKGCKENIVSNDKKVLKSHLDQAIIFLESTYGIKLDSRYDVCFESTVKIANTIKSNRNLMGRGQDIPLKAYIDDKKKAHVECSIPSASLSELIVRELTYMWQLNELPELSEELAEGHIALVAVQYLMFLNQNTLASVRTSYYESTNNISGTGYRKLVSELLSHPQFMNNPFRYLAESAGIVLEEIETYDMDLSATGDYGLPYKLETTDRCPEGALTYFYYSRLSDTHKQAYDAMLNAIKNHEATVEINNCQFDDVSKISDAIAYDHPELFWYKTLSMCGNIVKLIYGATAEESAVLQKKIDSVAAKYLEGIDESMSGYDVAIRIHAKLIAAVDYDTIALEKQKKEGGHAKDEIDYLRTICGVFLNGKAVCEGYTRAMQYLLQKCGIESAEAVGYIIKEKGETDSAHAWNIIKLDGSYYYIDATWDDSSNTVQTVKKNDLGFDYYCITTEEMSRTRDFKLCPCEMPECNDIKCNYYYHNNLVLDKYDLAKIRSIAQAAAKKKYKSFTFKCKTKAVYDQSINQLCVVGHDCYEAIKAAAKIDKNILTNKYSYAYEKNIYTITIKFKYK